MFTKKLTDREERFCREYIANGGYGGRAYMTVYAPKNDNVARVMASKALQKDHIKARIKALTEANRISAEYRREDNIAFLVSVRDNQSENMANRLRAADQLSRMNAEYIQRTENVNKEESTLDKASIDALLEARK